MLIQKGGRHALNVAMTSPAVGRDIANLIEGDVKSMSANYTVTREDHNAVILVEAVNLVATLPAASEELKGHTVTFFIITPSATTGFSLSPNAANQIKAKGITAENDKDLINTGATDEQGDLVTVVCDGSAGWVATNLLGTWARET